MFLIGKPYVSDFLIKTLVENQFEVVKTDEAFEILKDNSINWIDEKEAILYFQKHRNAPLYTNSENTISWVEKTLKFTQKPAFINVFKNKVAFRELLKSVYPNYAFSSVKFEELDIFSTNKVPFPFIIKPAVGFFSLGVHKVDNEKEWEKTKVTLKNDYESIMGFYPKEVLDATNFVVEECIAGEEYAIDCYFNNNGEAIVLNIMHHVFSSDKDVSDRIYYTSADVIEQTLPIVQPLVDTIGEKAQLTNFPIHIEVRIDNNNIIIPIEVNPMRFGGWCTTGDLANYAWGINSYEYFKFQQKPDWKTILSLKKTKKYSLILLDNNSGIEPKDIAYFDYDKLLNTFENPLVLRKVNPDKYPIFGFVFAETTIGNEAELDKMLVSDLTDFIVKK